MKKLSLLIALVAVIFGGCTKNYYGDEFSNPSYRVDGITDFTVSENQPAYNMNLQVAYMNGEQENVKVSLEGLPTGLYANIVRPSGVPTFSSYITFYDSSAAPGTYNVKLVTTGSVSGRKTFPITVTVNPVVDCRNELAGSYGANSFCTSGPNPFVVEISSSTSVSKRIVFDNFENSGVQIYGTVNCSAQSIQVPSQTIGGITYSGSGSFYKSSSGNMSVYVYYTRTVVGGGSSTCSVNMNK